MSANAARETDEDFRPRVLRGTPDDIEAEYAADHWNASRLGVAVRRGRGSANFAGITQEWLKEQVKEWSRFRLATGCAFGTITSGGQGMTRFSRFLGECHPEVVDETGITRALLCHYLSWLATSGYSTNTKLLSLSMLRGFLDACRRHGWLEGLPYDAVIYEEELPDRDEGMPRFVPEFVMAQLESDANLARLMPITTRHLVVLMIETGLRIGDACTLGFNPVIKDSSGWPCLSFHNLKVRADQLIPLSWNRRRCP